MGDQVVVFAGDGSEHPAEVASIEKRSIRLLVGEARRPDRELPLDIEIASAVPKGDREEFLIEKLTELGVRHFVPLITERSVVVPKSERLRRVVIEACKQCGRNRLMTVAEPTPWAEYISDNQHGIRWIASTSGGTAIQDVAIPTRSLSCAFGPEGGFTDEELRSVADWSPISLGPRVLRIETAAVALAAYVGLSAKTA